MIGTGRQAEGAIKVSDEVIAVCAVNAALKTEGVAGLSGDFPTLFRKISWKRAHVKGDKGQPGR